MREKRDLLGIGTTMETTNNYSHGWTFFLTVHYFSVKSNRHSSPTCSILEIQFSSYAVVQNVAGLKVYRPRRNSSPPPFRTVAPSPPRWVEVVHPRLQVAALVELCIHRSPRPQRHGDLRKSAQSERKDKDATKCGKRRRRQYLRRFVYGSEENLSVFGKAR